MKFDNVRSSIYIGDFVAEQFIEHGFESELIHGLRHLQHVMEVCDILIRECESLWPSKLAKCLRTAVAVHDLGRVIKGDHAETSAVFFREMPITDLSDEEKDAIYYAVKNHSRGLAFLGVKEAVTYSDMLLGLLCVCDHADAASPDGAARAALHMKNIGAPILSPRFSAEHLRRILDEGVPAEKMNEYKNDSLVAHWAYNYCATKPIISAVTHIIMPNYFSRHFEPRMAMFRALIEPLLKLQEATE